MKNILLVLIACIGLTAGTIGCAENTAYADPVLVSSEPATGCVVVEDDFGEREVCNTTYYVTSEGPIYWDVNYGIWIGAGGFWYGGVWHYGYYPGYWARYHDYYHEHGYYHSNSHGYYGHHFNNGSFHGNNYHGETHHSGGFMHHEGGGHHEGSHGGGGHGGHR
jgi:hypothetical protein